MEGTKEEPLLSKETNRFVIEGLAMTGVASLRSL